jgi:hypothetical protein
MQSRLDLLSGFNQWLKLRELNIADRVGLQVFLGIAKHDFPQCAEGLFIFWGEKSHNFTFTANTSCAATTMDVNLGIEGALIVEDT